MYKKSLVSVYKAFIQSCAKNCPWSPCALFEKIIEDRFLVFQKYSPSITKKITIKCNLIMCVIMFLCSIIFHYIYYDWCDHMTAPSYISSLFGILPPGKMPKCAVVSEDNFYQTWKCAQKGASLSKILH